MDFLLRGTGVPPPLALSSPFVAPFVFGIFFKSHFKTLQCTHFSPLGLHAEPKDGIPKPGYPFRGLLSLRPCDFGCALRLTPFRFALGFCFYSLHLDPRVLIKESEASHDSAALRLVLP